MNRKQEIGAWIFGLLIALALLASGNGIWALIILAGLSILSLRDRQKKRQKSTAVASTSPEGQALPGSGQPLKHLTPHLLAVIMLQRRAEGSMPFQEWRKPDVQFPSEADAMVALGCECYQLRIFVDLLQQRFGSPIAKLVENSFSTIMDSDSSGIEFFARADAAILRARALGPTQDGPNDPELRLDLQVADQMQAFVGESEEKKAALRLPLAQCLGFSRISAQAFFPDVIAKIDFDPASIAFVPRETAYRGTTNRWRPAPGCFERHLQRKEGNLLFPVSEQQPSDGALNAARSRDEDDVEKLKADVTALGKTLAGYLNQEGIPGGILADLLHYKVQPLMARSAAIGELANAQLRALQQLNEELMKGAVGSNEELAESLEAIRKGQHDLCNLFLAQASREDTPIASENFILALLCESTDTVKEAMEIFSRGDAAAGAQARGDVQALCNEAIGRVTEAAKQGFELPAAEEKLGLLAAYSKGTESTASA